MEAVDKDLKASGKTDTGIASGASSSEVVVSGAPVSKEEPDSTSTGLELAQEDEAGHVQQESGKFAEGDISGGDRSVSDEPLEKDVLVAAKGRRGQSKVRREVLEDWDGACAVTGCTEAGLLTASHIKPWCKCDTDNEWVDRDNCLPLAPNLNMLFDRGWITFDDEGQIVIANGISRENREALGISPKMKLKKPPNDRQKSFLRYHRRHIYRETC